MSGLQTLLLMLGAITLMFLDNRSIGIHHLREFFSVVTFPVYSIIDTPYKLIHSLTENISGQRKLLAENAQLRAEQLFLESKLQRLLALENENQQLRSLLKSTNNIPGRVIVGQLLAISLDPTLHQVVLDKGTRDHIYVGQPVFDAFGVLGQVINVGPLTSRILLVTDTRSAVPVQNSRTGSRAIAIGLGKLNELSLINIPDINDVKQGDVYITSGLGLRYPVGYPVGVVGQYKKVAGRLESVPLVPSAHLDRGQQVLLVWPDKVALTQTVEKQMSQTLPSIEE